MWLNAHSKFSSPAATIASILLNIAWVRAGVARAQRQGTKSGRSIGRPKLDAKREIVVRKALASGAGILKVAKSLGIGTGTVARIANELRTQR
jgi:DNA invertase Pin-like site-specific DNA recombinase